MTDKSETQPDEFPSIEATDEQAEMAEALAELLNKGPLEEDQLFAVDVLDALACLGLKLIADHAGEASISYMRELRKPASQAAPHN